MVALKQAERQIAMYQGGDAAAQLVIGDCMRELGIDAVATPQDLLRMAHQLILRGGLIEVVGRSLKVTAILMGANVAA
jgi:hypothetical protein